MRFALPPSIPDLEEVKIFEDALRGIIPDKIREAVERIEVLSKRRKEKLHNAFLQKRRGVFSILDELWVHVVEYEFIEARVLQKWLRYWLEIQSYIAPETLPTQSITNNENLLLSEKFKKAKMHPIEDLYIGQLRFNGNRLMGRCPFHDEKTASFVIYTDENTYHCFGCQAHGDSIDFVMATKKLSFIDTINKL